MFLKISVLWETHIFFHCITRLFGHVTYPEIIGIIELNGCQMRHLCHFPIHSGLRTTIFHYLLKYPGNFLSQYFYFLFQPPSDECFSPHFLNIRLNLTGKLWQDMQKASQATWAEKSKTCLSALQEILKFRRSSS